MKYYKVKTVFNYDGLDKKDLRYQKQYIICKTKEKALKVAYLQSKEYFEQPKLEYNLKGEYENKDYKCKISEVDVQLDEDILWIEYSY